MGLETGTYISDLVTTNPTATDQKSLGDDHIRLLKTCVKNSFPNLSAAVTVTAADLNLLSGQATSGEISKVIAWASATITAADLSKLDGAGVAVSGFLAGTATEWIKSDWTSSDILSITAHLASYTATYTTFGAPAVTADVTWTILSQVPSDALWVEVRGVGLLTTGAGGGNISTYARKYGGAMSANANQYVSYMTTGSSAGSDTNVFSFKVPYVSQRVDFQFVKSGSLTDGTIYLTLVGFGR